MLNKNYPNGSSILTIIPTAWGGARMLALYYHTAFTKSILIKAVIVPPEAMF